MISFQVMGSGVAKGGTTPGSDLFAGFLAQEAAGQRSAMLGYLFAVAAACIRGVSVFVNGHGWSRRCF